MCVTIFQQIFDSSIANNAKVRRMFIDVLILAALDGVAIGHMRRFLPG